MKITIVILFLIVFNMMATDGYSQNKKITIQAQQLTTKEVMKMIEHQTDYLFVYNRNEINVNRSVSVDIENKTITDVLSQIFANSDIDYRIIGKNISLIKRTEANASIANQQAGKKITGTVKDAKGESIIGANIVEKGTTNGIITDIDGNFSLEVSPGSTILVSYIGYNTQEVKVGEKSTLNITLQENSQALEEVVVIGYGTVKKENLTGSVATIKSDVFKSRPSASPATSLQGAVAGLSVIQSSNYPGSGASIKLREATSWDKDISSEPLYVIDGIQKTPKDFALLNPTDIDNISVLKDAASSAIYGMKAGNGVILITTKRGVSGKPSISYSYSYSTKKPTMWPEYMNAYDLSETLNETYRQYDMSPDHQLFYTPDEQEYFKTHSYEKDWIDAVWMKNPTDQTHNVSVSGGADAYRYYVSGSFLKQDGATNNHYQKYTFLAKIEGKIITGLDFSLNMNASWDKKDRPYWAYGNADDLRGLIARALGSAHPYRPVFINGLPTANFDNTNMGALARGDGGYVRKDGNSFSPTFELKYKIPQIEGLVLKAKASYNGHNGYEKTLALSPEIYYFKTTGAHNHIVTDEIDYKITDAAQTAGAGSPQRLTTKYLRDYYFQLDGLVEYQRMFGNHSISAIAGYEYLRSEGDFMETIADGFPNLNFPEVDGSLGKTDVKKRWISGNRDNLWAQASYIGRIDYNYNQKYLLGVTFRADGSYKFPPKKRWGYFPSVSAAWNIAKEAFFEPATKYVDMLKLRASWGITGSDQTKAWQWQQNYDYNSSSGILFNGVTGPLTSMAGSVNPYITWEKNQNIGIGLDIAMPKNLVTLSTDYWYKKTTDILGTQEASIPAEVGATLPAINYGEVSAQGFEMTIGHQNTIGKVNYRISGNIGLSNNKILKKDQAAAIRAHENRIGTPTFGDIYGFIAEGVIRDQAQVDQILAEHGKDFTILGLAPKPGMLMYKDLRGPAGVETPDGKIDDYDKEFISWNSIPRVSYGLSLAADWNGFDISVLFSGFARYEGIAQNYNFLGWGWGNNPSFWKDQWTPENKDSKYPGAVWTNDKSTFWLKNRSFMRLKNLSIGYNVNTTKLAPIKNLRFFISGENLLEFTCDDWMDYSDPELGDGGAYPILRSFTAGFNITL